MPAIEEFAIRDVLLQVTTEAIGGDQSWWNDLENLVKLYEAKELDPDAWAAPRGSIQHELFRQANLEYITALARWERIWSIVLGNHQQNNSVTYEMIADMLDSKKLEG